MSCQFAEHNTNWRWTVRADMTEIGGRQPAIKSSLLLTSALRNFAFCLKSLIPHQNIRKSFITIIYFVIHKGNIGKPELLLKLIRLETTARYPNSSNIRASAISPPDNKYTSGFHLQPAVARGYRNQPSIRLELNEDNARFITLRWIRLRC